MKKRRKQIITHYTLYLIFSIKHEIGLKLIMFIIFKSIL